jgi:glutathione synthase
MAMNVAVQMDPIDKINIAGDSTFALLLEARWRNLRVVSTKRIDVSAPMEITP